MTILLKMKGRKIQSKKRYLVSFIIGTFIFILVFLLSHYLSSLEFQRISNIQNEDAYEIFKDKLDYSFFEKDICSAGSFREVTEDLGFQGRIIDDLEKKLGKDDEGVLSRKKFYSLIEIEHLEFVQTLKKECDFEINLILFFYSNEKEYAKSSENLGRLLDSFYQRNEDVLIYSFDVNLESDLMDELKAKYDIEDPLTLIINNNQKLVNPQNILELEESI